MHPHEIIIQYLIHDTPFAYKLKFDSPSTYWVRDDTNTFICSIHINHEIIITYIDKKYVTKTYNIHDIDKAKKHIHDIYHNKYYIYHI